MSGGTEQSTGQNRTVENLDLDPELDRTLCARAGQWSLLVLRCGLEMRGIIVSLVPLAHIVAAHDKLLFTKCDLGMEGRIILDDVLSYRPLSFRDYFHFFCLVSAFLLEICVAPRLHECYRKK